MIQEAVLETLEGDRYIGFLVEQSVWCRGVKTTDDGLDAPDVLAGVKRIWRIVNSETGETEEGLLPEGSDFEQIATFRWIFRRFERRNVKPAPVPPEPVIPVDPYASHPNYGRF